MASPSMAAHLVLKPGHVQPIWSGHPWVYAQAVARVEGGAMPGDEVEVHDPRGAFLGRGFYSPRSALVTRIITRDKGVPIDGAFFRDRIARAVGLRKDLHLPGQDTNAFRLVHAEGDGLPGLIIDRFDDVCVVQLTTLGMKLREGMIFEALNEVVKPRAIVDRTPSEAAKMEGFEQASGIVRGDVSISELSFKERGLQFKLPMELSQKTGFYFDQRPLRARVEALAHGREVVDAFSFVGTFSLAAARGGATRVTAIDESPVAIEVGSSLARLNGLEQRINFVKGDARTLLKKIGSEGGGDLVICDPPKLAPTRASREEALGAYQRLAALACKATRPGGLLVLCSCSAAVSIDLLTRALGLGARDANRSAVVLERHFQGVDHPVPAAFPEGVYLKSLLVRIDSR
ncbi:MAG: class I SAM-dependent rRNA methyltransferase [Polyangiaceae bacterium]